MKLYTSRFAPNPHKIRLAVAELAIPCEQIELDVRARENRQPRFMAMNPNGNLPIIDDDGYILWESDAILMYLGRKHADKGLWPHGLREEADALRWLLYEIATLQPPAAGIWWERWLKPRLGAPKADDAEVRIHMDELQKPLRVLDKHMTDREWILGASYSLVDCAYTAVLNMLAIVGGASTADYRNVAGYWERLRSRPSFAACPFEFPVTA